MEKEIFTLKFFSSLLKDLNYIDKTVYYNNKRVRYVELIGIPLECGDRYIKILDFTGETLLIKDSDEKVQESITYSFLCVPYVKDSIIRLYCKGARRIDTFEEMFFWAEAINYKKISK